MFARLSLTLIATAASLAVALPVQARPLSAPYEAVPCYTCISWSTAAESAAVAEHHSQRVATLSEIRRPYTRFDIEGLRLLTRMR